MRVFRWRRLTATATTTSVACACRTVSPTSWRSTRPCAPPPRTPSPRRCRRCRPRLRSTSSPPPSSTPASLRFSSISPSSP
eukprot:2161916-Pleurochrysis_carterae.AAC.1